MNLSAPFIRRPVATILLSIALTHRFRRGAGELRGDRDGRKVHGRQGRDRQEAVGEQPRQFSTIPSIATISATNYQGFTSITVEFELSRNIDQGAKASSVGSGVVSLDRASRITGASAGLSLRKLGGLHDPVDRHDLGDELPGLHLDHRRVRAVAQHRPGRDRASRITGASAGLSLRKLGGMVSSIGSRRRVRVRPRSRPSRAWARCWSTAARNSPCGSSSIPTCSRPGSGW
jgi:hypothetical protein